MFGLTFEKLFLLAVIAAVVLGPHRLPEYARGLARTLRHLGHIVDDTKSKTLSAQEWEALDPRRFDPRRIAADALTSEPAEITKPHEHTAGRVQHSAAPAEFAASPEHRFRSDRLAEIHDQASRIRPGQRYLVVGDAAHPRRIRVDDLPPDDPRRVAAECAAHAPEPRITSAIASSEAGPRSQASSDTQIERAPDRRSGECV